VYYCYVVVVVVVVVNCCCCCYLDICYCCYVHYAVIGPHVTFLLCLLQLRVVHHYGWFTAAPTRTPAVARLPAVTAVYGSRGCWFTIPRRGGGMQVLPLPAIHLPGHHGSGLLQFLRFVYLFTACVLVGSTALPVLPLTVTLPAWFFGLVYRVCGLLPATHWFVHAWFTVACRYWLVLRVLPYAVWLLRFTPHGCTFPHACAPRFGSTVRLVRGYHATVLTGSAWFTVLPTCYTAPPGFNGCRTRTHTYHAARRTPHLRTPSAAPAIRTRTRWFWFLHWLLPACTPLPAGCHHRGYCLDDLVTFWVAATWITAAGFLRVTFPQFTTAGHTAHRTRVYASHVLADTTVLLRISTVVDCHSSTRSFAILPRTHVYAHARFALRS